MHHLIDEPECSQCGAKHSETFQRPGIEGRRCLVCGHEQIIRTRDDGTEEPAIWTSSHTRPSF